MKTQFLAIITLTAIIFVGCSNPKDADDDNTDIMSAQPAKNITSKPKPQTASDENAVVEKKSYTLDEIYNTMCIECHSDDGSGNTDKLTPSMRGMELTETETALKDVEQEEGHVIMQHNREKIIQMGMEYDAKEMAKYMFDRFKN